MENINKYLTIHGHFYQPPRENPWLEEIELQISANPYHDWNERIAEECYNPNSCSKIVNNENKIMDIVNNYSLMSFNFGPTLMSWLEKYSPLCYERIIEADVKSRDNFSGHGNAIAQVYNHMIMPLANKNDKITQVIWGIKDFEYRFGRSPEGMWLAETAVDDETLEVLADNGIKFTILSPFQADKFRKIGDNDWIDVSWGNIDPARPYRCYCKNNPEKYIDIFFYDGAISKSVAFDELLKDGQKFAYRLGDGISSYRSYQNQLVNIATDGESYGHHTKFGDMALSYVLKIKARENGFNITNYGEYLEMFPPEYEVEVKQSSSWSCFHGVGRWKEDCGCSTGGHQGWNQKWRKPLREALDFLRDKLITIYEKEGKKYFSKNVYEVRNRYISVVLDRSDLNVAKFIKTNFKKDLHEDEIIKGMKLLETQRQAMLMYTSCGWFFSEISGIETVQIMKYAARAMQLASDYLSEDFENEFLNILENAESNIREYENGKVIYEKFVKPSAISLKQIASIWAITSLYKNYEKESELYCYTVTQKNYKKVQRGGGYLVLGELEIKSNITLEKSNVIFALVQYHGSDFHCAITESSDSSIYSKIKPKLVNTYLNQPLTEVIRALDSTFGKEYFTLKDIFYDERKTVIKKMLRDKLDDFSEIYKDIYSQAKETIYQLENIEVKIPYEIKVAAQYTLTNEFNALIRENSEEINENVIVNALEILAEADKIGVEVNKSKANNLFSQIIMKKIFNLTKMPELARIQSCNVMFEYINKLNLDIDVREAQNAFFNNLYKEFAEGFEEDSKNKSLEDIFIYELFKLAQNLDIDTTEAKSLYSELKLKVNR